MFSFLSLKNSLFKKIPINYSNYYAIYLYLIFRKYKIFLFIQKNQFGLKKIINNLIVLNLINNYIKIDSYVLKLLFNLGDNFTFIYRESILIFFNEDFIIHNILSNEVILNSIVFICYNNFFINVKYLGVINMLFNLFLSNLNNFKINVHFIMHCVMHYFYFIFSNIKV